MPTILMVMGWRFFFYSNEKNEPVHVHCKKSEKECKYWLDIDNFDIEEAYSYNMNNKDKREVKKIIFEHFEYIGQEWNKFQRRVKK
jgi:formylmethanofuran dehydrogenase subunit A